MDKKLAFPENEVKSIMIQLLHALRHVHAQNVVHRDVKPDNLLFCEEKGLKLKLTDFGLSALCPCGKLLRDDCGSEFYIPPEMIVKRPYGRKVDLWSAGVTMFILLTNKMPFSGSSLKETLKKVLEASIPSKSDRMWKLISPECQDLLRKLLMKDPDQRLDTDEALDHPWFTGEPLVSPSDSLLISIEDQNYHSDDTTDHLV